VENYILKIKNKIKNTFSSLRHPGYRLWFIGQLISMMGTWVQITAQGFLLYELTHSMAYLGYMGVATGLPSVIFMLYAGVLADRFPKKKILAITQASMMLLAFILYALVTLGIVKPWHILLLATLLGIANAFDVPARQSFVIDLVEKSDTSNAIALNSMVFNLAAIVGPSIAGIIYAAFGASSCFLINGISFFGIIAVLLIIKVPDQKNIKADSSHTWLHELKEGIGYCLRNKELASFITITFMISSVGMSYATLLPAWATNILNGDAKTFGHLNSSRGIGSFIGALFLASLGSRKLKPCAPLFFGMFTFPIFLLLFANNNTERISYIYTAGIGLGLMLTLNSLNSLVQSLTKDKLRGRVMSIFSLAFFGGMPVGAFFAGNIAEKFGAKLVVELSALLSILIGIIYLMKTVSFTSCRLEDK